MRRIALALAIVALSAPAAATTFFEQKFTCPVGGKTFKAAVIGSSSSWGQRPDGRAYGTTPVWPMTECPDNGLILFEREFSRADIARLTPLVASADYQAMRKSDSQYYRAWWLKKNLGRDAFELTDTLLVASWEVDEWPEVKARYQQQFAAGAMALEWSEEKASPWFWLRLRAANALRELGRFDESAALLADIDRPGRLPADAEELKGARWLIDGLTALNADRNRASEPANLIPPRMAAERCKQGELSAAEIHACNSKDVKAAGEDT